MCLVSIVVNMDQTRDLQIFSLMLYQLSYPYTDLQFDALPTKLSLQSVK